MRRILVIIVALVALAVPVSALAHGPQSLPAAACNEGTANAHTSLGANAAGHDRIPHDHHPGLGCVHLNPAANPLV